MHGQFSVAVVNGIVQFSFFVYRTSFVKLPNQLVSGTQLPL